MARRWLRSREHEYPPPPRDDAPTMDIERACVGSENFTCASLSQSREDRVIALEPEVPALMGTTFDSDRAPAAPF